MRSNLHTPALSGCNNKMIPVPFSEQACGKLVVTVITPRLSRNVVFGLWQRFNAATNPRNSIEAPQECKSISRASLFSSPTFLRLAANAKPPGRKHTCAACYPAWSAIRPPCPDIAPAAAHNVQATTLPRSRRAIYSSVIRGTLPSPLIFWNHGVRAGLPSKSLRNKDLHAKYSGQRT